MEKPSWTVLGLVLAQTYIGCYEMQVIQHSLASWSNLQILVSRVYGVHLFYLYWIIGHVVQQVIS